MHKNKYLALPHSIEQSQLERKTVLCFKTEERVCDVNGVTSLNTLITALTVTSPADQVGDEDGDDQKGKGNADSDGYNIIGPVVAVHWGLKTKSKIYFLSQIF